MGSNTKKLAVMSVLMAVSLIVFIIEAQLPLPVPVPGFKPGLSNAVTLFALFYTYKDGQNTLRLTNINVFFILFGRILLSALITGRPFALALSLSGGMLGFAAQIITKRFVSERQIWVCGAIGAMLHNIGQIIAAMMLMGTTAVAVYLPILIILGAISGSITGLIAQLTLQQLSKSKNHG